MSPNNRSLINVVHGGRRNNLNARLTHVSTVNINKVTRNKAIRVISQLAVCILLIGFILQILKMTTSNNIGPFKKTIVSLANACLNSLDAAIRIAESMKHVPQSAINAGTGITSSLLGNLSTLRRPSAKKALLTGAATAVGMSFIPMRGTALKSLVGIRNMVKPSKAMRVASTVYDWTIVRAALTAGGLPTSSDFFINLAKILTRYLVNFAAAYGISVSKSLYDWRQYRKLNNSLKRASLLSEQERLKLTSRLINTITRQTLTNVNAANNNTRNAAQTLLLLRRQ